MTTFNNLGLSKSLLDTLEAHGFTTPTPIQQQAIPMLIKGRDLIGLAQTGTGKTAAFGLPIIEMLMGEHKRPEPRSTRCLILAPTRELVNQIAANLKIFMKKTPLKVALIVGGASINKQQMQMERGVDVLVATPGRLLDLIARRALTLGHVSHLVLDEADQMLDLGFIHDLKKIAKMVPARRQTLLFSATMPKAIADLASDFLRDPVTVEVSPAGKTADRVEQFVHFVAGKNDKTTMLKDSLDKHPEGRSIVFMRTKHTAEKLMKYLDSIGYKVASIHGNKSQGQRERALQAFRNGDVATLIATDVAARGIDIPGVTHVYNYDLPEVAEAYVHRIGRTARAGREGIAIAYCTPDEARLLRDIEKLTGIELTVASGEAPTGKLPAFVRPTRAKTGGNRGGAARPARPARPKFEERGERPAGEARPERKSGEGRPERKPPQRTEQGANRNHKSGHTGRPGDAKTGAGKPANGQYRRKASRGPKIA